MSRVRSVDRFYKCQLIHVLGDVWENLTDPHSGFTILLKPEWRLKQVACGCRDNPRFCKGNGLVVILCKLRLVVKSVDLTWATMHKQKDDSLGLRGKVRLSRNEVRFFSLAALIHESGKCHGSKADRRAF